MMMMMVMMMDIFSTDNDFDHKSLSFSSSANYSNP